MHPRLCLGASVSQQGLGPCPLRCLSALAFFGLMVVDNEYRGGDVGTRGWQGVRPYPAFLHFSGGHDDDTGVLLPRHLPEVVDGGVQAALAGDVGLRVLIGA